MYIIFSQVTNISCPFFSSLSASWSFVFREVKYDFFKIEDEGTWQKHLEKYSQHKIVDQYPQVCPRHRCRRKKLLQWKSINTHTRTRTPLHLWVRFSDQGIVLRVSRILSLPYVFLTKYLSKCPDSTKPALLWKISDCAPAKELE